jgi:hypothetical protein
MKLRRYGTHRGNRTRRPRPPQRRALSAELGGYVAATAGLEPAPNLSNSQAPYQLGDVASVVPCSGIEPDEHVATVLQTAWRPSAKHGMIGMVEATDRGAPPSQEQEHWLSY